MIIVNYKIILYLGGYFRYEIRQMSKINKLRTFNALLVSKTQRFLLLDWGFDLLAFRLYYICNFGGNIKNNYNGKSKAIHTLINIPIQY